MEAVNKLEGVDIKLSADTKALLETIIKAYSKETLAAVERVRSEPSRAGIEATKKAEPTPLYEAFKYLYINLEATEASLKVLVEKLTPITSQANGNPLMGGLIIPDESSPLAKDVNGISNRVGGIQAVLEYLNQNIKL